jgi:CRP-like cAMP-binding protein
MKDNGKKRSRTVMFTSVAAIVVLLNVADDGVTSGIAMIGNDGMLGVSLLLGVDIARSRAVVQRAGDAFRISWPTLEQLYRQSAGQPAGLQQLFLRCAHALNTQLAQTAVCNRRHLVKQRLSSWLLWMLAHSPSCDIYATHESIAMTLGVRREAITEALGRLHDARLVKGGRGRITVLDRHGLKLQACNCHEIIRSEHRRLFHEAPREQDIFSPPHSRPAGEPPEIRNGGMS